MIKVPKTLESVLEKTINVLEESKQDIFRIAESSRKEYENIKSELNLINIEVNEIIDKIDRLEIANKRARLKLMEVSQDFKRHTEIDIKRAYKKAEDTSVEIAVLKEKEEQLIKRRKELENRLLNLKNNVEKAENLVSKMGIIKDYLMKELSSLSRHFDDLKQKKDLAIKIIQAQEEERRRVARDIHDGPAQSIANLVFRVELAQQLIDKDIEKAKEVLVELKDLIRLSMQDVRKIIYDLRPMSLDDLGLIPTLKRYINKFMDETGIIVDLEVTGEKRRLSKSYEVTIFRLIQEALNNVYKHSNATTGQVRLEYMPDQINLMVKDDGVGFDPDQIEGDKFGLISMKERCKLLGGRIDVKSQVNKGTTIKVIFDIGKGE